MGKNSRRKKEQRQMKPSERKVLKELIKESSPEVFGNDGVVTYYNPLKKLLKQKPYKSTEGATITHEMVTKYQQFLKAKLEEEKNGVKVQPEP